MDESHITSTQQRARSSLHFYETVPARRQCLPCLLLQLATICRVNYSSSSAIRPLRQHPHPRIVSQECEVWSRKSRPILAGPIGPIGVISSRIPNVRSLSPSAA